MKNKITGMLCMLLFLLMYGSYAKAQIPGMPIMPLKELFIKNVFGGAGDDDAFSIIQTTDGGYAVAGYTASNNGDVSGNHGDMDMWVVKLDSKGSIQWQKALGGSSRDVAYSIVQTADGGYAVAGYALSDNWDVSGNHGGYDMWIVKLNASGIIQWQKTLGGPSQDMAFSIIQTTDGGYAVAGYTASNNGDVSGNHGGYDMWVVKLNSFGSVQWQKTLGGSSNERADSITQTIDGGYAVAGYTQSNNGDVSGNHGSRDMWVVKLNSAGFVQWQKTFGGLIDEEARSIIQTADGGYAVAGHTTSDNGDVSANHGLRDMWVIKITSTGSLQWQKALGGTGNEEAYSIVQAADGGYAVAGSAYSNNGDVQGNNGGGDAWIVKLNTAGMIQWQKALGGSNFDYALSIIKTTEGGYAIAGTAFSPDGDINGPSNGSREYFIPRIDSAGRNQLYEDVAQ